MASLSAAFLKGVARFAELAVLGPLREAQALRPLRGTGCKDTRNAKRTR